MLEIVRLKNTFLLLLATATICPVAQLCAQGNSASPASAPSSDVPADLPKYDVATIKPTSASDGGMRFLFTPDGITVSGVPVQMLLREAFHIENDHIIGAPGWVRTTRFDVEAKVSPEDAPKLDKLTFEERRSMLVPLLVERFNLKYHHESRELA